MPKSTRRLVTGHDTRGKSVVLTDGPLPQHHSMRGPVIGADFHELWSDADTIPERTSVAAREPNERPFTIMPVTGHPLRLLDVYPLKDGGKRTVMHRTRTLDSVVVQWGTDHAWENRSSAIARAAFFHIDARFSEEVLARLPKPLVLTR